MNGELFICPTESSYLLGAHAFNDQAVACIYQVKKRDLSKPLPLVVKDIPMARNLGQFNPLAERLVEKYWPGPLTIILPAKTHRGKKFQGGSGSIGMRVPSFPLLQQILRHLDFPLVSTSANISDHQEPYSSQSILALAEETQGKITLILDAGHLPLNPPSTVIDLTGGKICLLRQGAIHSREIMSYISPGGGYLA
jgi:L-threonylcarbamoyladenylate synthase